MRCTSTVITEKRSAGVPCLLISGTVGMTTLHYRRVTSLIKTCALGKPFYNVINTWRACAFRPFLPATAVNPSECYSSWFVCLSVCLVTLIQALQATRQHISDTNGYATLTTPFESGSDATYYTLPPVYGVVAKAASSGAHIRCYLGSTPETTTFYFFNLSEVWV